MAQNQIIALAPTLTPVPLKADTPNANRDFDVKSKGPKQEPPLEYSITYARKRGRLVDSKR